MFPKDLYTRAFAFIPLKLPSLQLNGTIIEIENSFKFFGVILDEHLIWKKHVQLTENRISENVRALYKTKLIKLIKSN